MDTEIGEYSYSIRWIFDEKDLHEIDSRSDYLSYIFYSKRF